MRQRGTAIVIRENRVLLVKDRGKRKYSLPGGGTKKSEPYLAAAIRELYEEVAMSAVKAERLFNCDFKGSYNSHKVCLIQTEDTPTIQSRELEEYLWWDRIEDIPRYSHVDQILNRFFKKT